MMSLEILRNFLQWCTLLNVGILLIWFGGFVFAHESIQELHGKWFRLSHEQFDAIHYAGMALFKIGIWLFNLVPLLALYIIM